VLQYSLKEVKTDTRSLRVALYFLKSTGEPDQILSMFENLKLHQKKLDN
jgi:hypothetical protein